MVFSEKWPKNDPHFLLHFLIHIDILMLCSKFELILTKNSEVTSIYDIILVIIIQILERLHAASYGVNNKVNVILAHVYIINRSYG